MGVFARHAHISCRVFAAKPCEFSSLSINRPSQNGETKLLIVA